MSVAEPDLGVLPQRALLIGEQRIDDSSGGEFQHIYAATGKPTTCVTLAGAREMVIAVQSARDAQSIWCKMPARQRRELMWRLSELISEHSDELSVLQTIESSVPRRFATEFPGLAADFIAYNAGWTDKIGGDVIQTWPMPAIDYACEEPYGVVAVIIPWNASLVSIGQLLGPILAAGNAIVLKPSELAAFVALRVGELVLESGFPPGLVNVVPGDPQGAMELVRQTGVDKIHFTGSPSTARKILTAASDNLTPTTFELGGKSALLIFADADIGAAVQQALAGLVALSGQGCTNSTRVLVESSIYEQCLRLVSGFTRRLRVGDPFDDGTDMGPVVSVDALNRILALVNRAVHSKPSRLICGGSRLGDALANGYFVAPTIFADLDLHSEIIQEEIFGPVISIERFSTECEAIARANATRYGLASYVYSNDVSRAHRVSQRLAVGNVWINGLGGLSPSMPFGGVKHSGYGRVGGRAGLREFTRPKNVWLGLNQR